MSEEKSLPNAQDRVMAVDALRGFDMFWIVGGGELVRRALRIFVDPMPAPIEHQFDHVPWEGFVAWDLIMPLFLFIVGTSMPLAYARRMERGQTRWDLYRHMIRRVAILWVLGMIAQGHLLSFDPGKIHFYSNTLQAIASGYLIATIIILNVGVLGQMIAILALLAVFWGVMMFVPVPGYGAGSLTPSDNVAMYVDKLILGRFRDGTMYTWILSSLTFGATVLLGVMSGHILRAAKPPKTKALWLLGAGVAGIVLGWVTGIWFPIIKHIWTSSMVLYAAGWSFLLLAFFYWVIDVLQCRRWAFGFVVIGANAIVAYMVGEAFSVGGLEDLIFGKAANIPLPAAFGMAAVVFGLFWLALYLMYRKKIFVRI